MANISLSFPDQTYTSSNKPSADTLKADLTIIETGVNANDAATVKTTDTNVKANSWVLDEDAMGSDSDQKVATQQSVKAYVDAAITATKTALFPVGSTYVNYSVATNPGTLLGFGTWVAITDEVLVGIGSGTFASIGSVGAETSDVSHTHTGPSHTHGDAHTHLSLKNALQSNGFSSEGGDDSNALTYSQSSETTDAGGTGATGSGGSATQSLVQGSRVVYMWRRSA
jgi:hypothetical protein